MGSHLVMPKRACTVAAAPSQCRGLNQGYRCHAQLGSANAEVMIGGRSINQNHEVAKVEISREPEQAT